MWVRITAVCRARAASRGMRSGWRCGRSVMEPFVMSGGGVGSDIKVWRDLSNGATTEQLDADARRSVEYLRYVFEGPNSDYRSVLRK